MENLTKKITDALSHWRKTKQLPDGTYWEPEKEKNNEKEVHPND